MNRTIVDDEVLLTVPGRFKHKVSSVLNKSSEFSSKNMFMKETTSCWNSDQGKNQYIFIEFENVVCISRIVAVFQGGFVGLDGCIEIGERIDSLSVVETWDTLEDSNSPQELRFSSPHVGKYLKITFPASSDFYGRVTIYSLEVYGRKNNEDSSS